MRRGKGEMSNASNNNGRAYEYISLITLQKEIVKVRSAEIEKNSSYESALNDWKLIPKELQKTLEISAKTATYALFDYEPRILENDNELLVLQIQTDTKGKEGDVRDIVITRDNIQWEIGLSLKHNHFAVKHSRLAKTLDFGEKWYGIKCSSLYWQEIAPIFSYLEDDCKGLKWSEILDKIDKVYIPLLTAFKNEIKRANNVDPSIPRKLVEYLLGKFDFYKVISLDNRKVTQIQTYNLRGKLNQAAGKIKPKIIIPVASLPTRIIDIEFKHGSTNTIELYMDNGWQFNFRIHNAATYVETSLKFDIQIVGMPASIICIDCKWNGE